MLKAPKMSGLRAAAVLIAAAALGSCGQAPPEADARVQARRVAAVAGPDMSDVGLRRLRARMDSSMLTLVERHDSVRRTDLWDRPQGWGALRLDETPNLGFSTLEAEPARRINALLAFDGGPIAPMRPFVLKASGEDRVEALKCLSQAIYYEAAREPLDGQRAVAQTVLNRVRHPAYPKSVCGVVFQGAARTTGCQFSFTCDGSLRWAPEPALWRRAQGVAKAALAGFVQEDIGSATHYHADYVAPYWAPTLVKLTKIGAHIFYRWTGPAGQPAAFTGRYAGREAHLTPAILQGADPRIQGLFAPEAEGLGGGRKVTLAVAGEVRTYTVADPTAKGGERTRVLGTLQPARRTPTPEQVREINARLSDMEKTMGADAPPQADASPAVEPNG